MSSVIIAVIDATGAVFFLLALRWGIHNFRHESEVSEFWVAYSMAMGAGALFAFVKAVEWLGVVPELANMLQPFLATIMGTVFTITAIVCVVSPIKRTIK